MLTKSFAFKLKKIGNLFKERSQILNSIWSIWKGFL